jgi:hypothetical protein
MLIAENRCAALFVSTVSPALQRVRRSGRATVSPARENADPKPYLDRPLGPRLPRMPVHALKSAVTDAERSELAELLKDDVWFYERALQEYERRVSEPRVAQLVAAHNAAMECYRRAMISEQIFESPSSRRCSMRSAKGSRRLSTHSGGPLRLWSSHHEDVAPVDLDHDVVSCNMTGDCPLEARGR